MLRPPLCQTLPQVFIITVMEIQITHSPQVAFFENLFRPAEMGVGNYYGVKKFEKFTGKHLCRSLSLKMCSPPTCIFIKK